MTKDLNEFRRMLDDEFIGTFHKSDIEIIAQLAYFDGLIDGKELKKHYSDIKRGFYCSLGSKTIPQTTDLSKDLSDKELLEEIRSQTDSNNIKSRDYLDKWQMYKLLWNELIMAELLPTLLPFEDLPSELKEWADLIGLDNRDNNWYANTKIKSFDMMTFQEAFSVRYDKWPEVLRENVDSTISYLFYLVHNIHGVGIPTKPYKEIYQEIVKSQKKILGEGESK